MKPPIRRALAVVGINLFVTFAVLEITLRIFPALVPVGLLRYFNAELRADIAARRDLLNRLEVVTLPRDDGGVPHRLWHFAPGSRHHGNVMDARGFCNPAPAPATEGETVEILFLGDSFTYCWGVPAESTWTARTAAAIEARDYNLGVPDMGPYEYVQFLKHVGVRLNPDVVVMAIYEGNDLRDAVRHTAYRNSMASQATENDGPAGAGDLSRARRLYHGIQEGPLGRHSYVTNLLLTGVGVLYKGRFEDRAISQNNFRFALTFGDQIVPLNDRNVDADELEYARQLRRGRISLEVFTDALEEFVRLSGEHGFSPVVVFMPSAHATYANRVQFQDSTVAELMPWVHDALVSYFARQAKALGYRFADFTLPLQSAAQGAGADDLLYRRNDLHFTDAGHAEAARAASAVLSTR